jgi:hypothetical protein
VQSSLRIGGQVSITKEKDRILCGERELEKQILQ